MKKVKRGRWVGVQLFGTPPPGASWATSAELQVCRRSSGLTTCRLALFSCKMDARGSDAHD
eukprot:scaffold195726_cov14-Tisochrysis_lutea.AAC.1